MKVRERALLFGAAKSLVGVVSEPAAGPGARLGVVLLDAGVLHRVGPNRIHVRLARRLAQRGVSVLRFDFSGLGDSAPRRDQTSFARAILAEIGEALDVLGASRDVTRFVLAGMCSGADAALRAAAREPRVVGAALIEAYTIPTTGHLVRSYRHKLLSPRSWVRLFAGRSELWSTLRERRRRGGPPPPPAAAAGAEHALVPTREELLEQVRTLIRRDCALCLLYAERSPAHHNYRAVLESELREARAGGGVRVEVLSGTDHVFTPLAIQGRLVEILCDWTLSVVARCGLGAAAPGAPVDQ